MNAFPLYLSYFELLQPLPLDLIVVDNLKNVSVYLVICKYIACMNAFDFTKGFAFQKVFFISYFDP